MPSSSAPLPSAPVLSLGRWRAVPRPDGYSYLVSTPADAVHSGNRRWPLLIFLHGAAERGTDLVLVVRYGIPRLVAASAELTPPEQTIGRHLVETFIVVAPQCPPQDVWDDQAVLALLGHVQQEYPVDAARIYLTGLSMGGFGVWTLGMRHPQRFAAIVPVCGGGRIRDIVDAVDRQPAAIRSLGIWAFHGARDRIVPLEESQRMIDALHGADLPAARLTVYPDVEHDAWNPAYLTPELYSWLLQHAR